MDATNEVISSLKFIGKLKKGDKINTKFMYTQPDGVWTRFSRTFINQDNRHNTLNFLQRTIFNAFEVITTHKHSKKQSEIKMIKNIIEDLKNAKTGLSNIRETYSSDLKFNCDISTLLQTIDSKLEDIGFSIEKDKHIGIEIDIEKNYVLDGFKEEEEEDEEDDM